MARVLVVEPDRQICRFVAAILADFGHDVTPCDDPRRTANWLCRARFDVLASDVPSDLGEPAALRPGLRCVSLSGRRLALPGPRRQPPPRLRDKPFRFADLHALVRAVGATQPDYAAAA